MIALIYHFRHIQFDSRTSCVTMYDVSKQFRCVVLTVMALTNSVFAIPVTANVIDIFVPCVLAYHVHYWLQHMPKICNHSNKTCIVKVNISRLKVKQRYKLFA